ncbi:MAG: cupin [Hyphomicrobiales bacterium]|nr:cupin [Hyphomicrobiales bacterium]
MPGAGNIFSGVRLDPAGEQFLELARSGGMRIERIVSSGQTTPEGEWYDQAWTEWVLLLQGGAHVLFEGEAEPRILQPGDWLEIRPRQRHRVVYTDAGAATIWLAVHDGP